MNVTLGRAINLLKAGFSVITIGDSKQPNFSWKQNQSKALTIEKLTEYGNYSGGIKKKDGSEISPTSGFGIITGYWDVECIDVDLKVFPSVQEGRDWWNEFVSFLKDYVDDFEKRFVIYKTVNSGYHIIYRCKKVEGNQKLATLKGHKSALLETRGKGGYIYTYDNQISKIDYLGINEIDISERDMIIGLCRYFNYEEKVDEHIQSVKVENEGLTPWDDYNNRNESIDIIRDELTAVKQLSDRIVLRKNGSKDPLHGFIYKDTGLTYLFTTATIYPHEKALSPFSIYSWKYFNGNFSEAAKELYKQGYGERKIKKVEIERPEVKKDDLVFPIDIFPPDVQSYILQNQVTLNHSIDYMGSSFIWLIALCIGNACKIEVKKGWIESANVWMGLIGRAGLGKTPSINAMIFPIEKRNAFEIKQYQKEYRKWKEYEKLSAKEKKDHEEVREPARKQFIVNDVTIEALADLHEENENGVGVFKDELNGWLKDMNKYKPGSDLEFWLSCWSGKPANLTRKTAKSSFIEMPLMPVLGGIQPGIFSQISTNENKDNGFLDRLLLSFPEKEIEHYNRKAIGQDVLDWYEAYVCQFFDEVRNKLLEVKFESIVPIVVRFDEGADLEWERIFNNLSDMQNSDDVNEYVKSMLSKQKSYVPRFALILHCLDSYTFGKPFGWISKETMINAEKLSNYYIAMSKKIKVSMLESMGLKDIIQSMKSEPVEQIVKHIFATVPDSNKGEVAEMLNISKRSVYNYLKK